MVPNTEQTGRARQARFPGHRHPIITKGGKAPPPRVRAALQQMPDATNHLLIMAYGGPNSLDDVRPYLLDVRNYRPTSDHVVDEITDRYRQIGGRSPILELTRAEAAGIEQVLNGCGLGCGTGTRS
jgi:hypothetical protein